MDLENCAAEHQLPTENFHISRCGAITVLTVKWYKSNWMAPSMPIFLIIWSNISKVIFFVADERNFWVIILPHFISLIWLTNKNITLWMLSVEHWLSFSAMSLGVFSWSLQLQVDYGSVSLSSTRLTCSFEKGQISWDVKTYSSCTKLLEAIASV